MERAVEAGASGRATTAKFELSPSFVIELMQRWRRHGTVQPARIGGRQRAKLAAHAARVPASLAAEPDLTIAELRRGSRRVPCAFPISPSVQDPHARL